MFRRIICAIIFAQLLGNYVHAQDKVLSWNELHKVYKYPSWYTEARFGIWVHWGAQTAPLKGGGWYARHMYMKDVGHQKWGKDAYSYHQKIYGHQSEIGFKDVINTWKAEKLDADSLVKYFKSVGAKYFVALANHHDHFDNFDSTYQPWNSVNVGPHKDLIGEFAAAARKADIPFGVSSHDDRFLTWWVSAFGSDKSGPKKGVPYDGNMTKADGKGKWWEGLDPADLYGLPPAKRTPEYIRKVKENWLLRHRELVTKYNVDMIWFDGFGFPYGKYGKELCTYFLNRDYADNGEFNRVIVAKINNEPIVVKDIERGGSKTILNRPWQGITTFRTWFYKEDYEEYKQNSRTVIELLCDYSSKNGNLLLNVELLADGTIPAKQKEFLDEIGGWLGVNGEAIYATRAWKIMGDNLGGGVAYNKRHLSETDLDAQKKQKKSEQFNERDLNSPPYPYDEVRFTTKDKHLYMFVLNPEAGEIEIPSLGFKSKYNDKKISAIRMLGSDSEIRYHQDAGKLNLTVPDKRPTRYATVFEIDGIL